MEAPSVEKAQNQAFRLLALRPRSEKELRDKLLQNYTADIADLVIQKCKDNGYLNDNAFALGRARQLALYRLKGNRFIEADLSCKGLDQKIISDAIQTIRRELSEKEAIEKVIEKKLKKPSLAGRQEREKMGRYLLSRGFAADSIFAILNRQADRSHTDCGDVDM